MDIAQLQAYGYFFLIGFLVLALYGYIYHLYTSKKKYGKDYEMYSDIALHDDITDLPVEKISEDEEPSEDKK